MAFRNERERCEKIFKDLGCTVEVNGNYMLIDNRYDYCIANGYWVDTLTNERKRHLQSLREQIKMDKGM